MPMPIQLPVPSARRRERAGSEESIELGKQPRAEEMDEPEAKKRRLRGNVKAGWESKATLFDEGDVNGDAHKLEKPLVAPVHGVVEGSEPGPGNAVATADEENGHPHSSSSSELQVFSHEEDYVIELLDVAHEGNGGSPPRYFATEHPPFPREHEPHPQSDPIETLHAESLSITNLLSRNAELQSKLAKATAKLTELSASLAQARSEALAWRDSSQFYEEKWRSSLEGADYSG